LQAAGAPQIVAAPAIIQEAPSASARHMQSNTSLEAAAVSCQVTHLQLHNVLQLPDLRRILLRKRCGPAHSTAHSKCALKGAARAAQGGKCNRNIHVNMELQHARCSPVCLLLQCLCCCPAAVGRLRCCPSSLLQFCRQAGYLALQQYTHQHNG
jgi:hypothetical protein